MKQQIRTFLVCGLLAALPTFAAPVADEVPSEPAPGPLEAMSRLVGGTWKIGPLSHVFEFGIARHTLHARSYYTEGNFVSEARWFWHPGEKTIKGYAVDAAGSGLTEMTTTFEGDRMTNVLVLTNGDGESQQYVGEWVFVDADRYDWTLYSETAGKREKQFEATGNRESPSR